MVADLPRQFYCSTVGIANRKLDPPAIGGIHKPDADGAQDDKGISVDRDVPQIEKQYDQDKDNA